MRYMSMRFVRRQAIRTFAIRIELAAPFDGIQQQFAKRIADRLAHLRREIGVELRHDRLDAVGRLARARHDELDPLGPRRNHLDRRRVGCGERVANGLQQRRSSTGLCTYLNACSRTAFSSVSGASSDVITTTRGRDLIGRSFASRSRPFIRGIQTSSSSRSKCRVFSGLERFDAVLGH